jgi:archaellum component FlaC
MATDDTIEWGWIRRTLTAVQAEQRMLRGLVEPLPKRFQALEERMSAMEARFGAMEARIGGIEESLNGIGLILRQQTELLAQLAGTP